MLILYIEDDDNDVCLVEMAGRKARVGAQIWAVPTVVEAQAYLEAQGQYADRAVPDLILLDLFLPGRDGFDFLRWRKHTPWAAIPLVAFTSSLDSQALERATALGANLSFPKPNSFSDLVWLVGELCQAVTAPPTSGHSPLRALTAASPARSPRPPRGCCQ